MFRKTIVSVLLLAFFSGTILFSQNEALDGNTGDFSSYEKRFKAVDESLNYLKNRNIDCNDLITLYTDAESLFREMKYASEVKDADLTMRFLSHKLSILEEKSLERVSLTKRMDFIYMIMVVMGLTIVIVMSIYSIYMYSRRK